MAIILSFMVHDVEPETNKAAENGLVCRQTVDQATISLPLMPVLVVAAAVAAVVMPLATAPVVFAPIMPKTSGKQNRR